MANSADAATLHAVTINRQHPDGGLAQLFLAADGIIERRRAENIFKQLDERSLTEDEQQIIQQRVEWQRTLLWEYEKREQKRKVKELQDLCPELSDAAAARALELCFGKEDDAVLRLTEDAAFKRRLMTETGTFTAAAGSAPRPQGSSSLSRSSSSNSCRHRNDQSGPSCVRLLKPSQLNGKVFVGRFRSKLGPLQERAIADAAQKAAAEAAAAAGQPMPKRRGRPRKLRPPTDHPSATTGTAVTASRATAVEAGGVPSTSTRAPLRPEAETAGQPAGPAAAEKTNDHCGVAEAVAAAVIRGAAAAATGDGCFARQRSSSPSAMADSTGDESDLEAVSDTGSGQAAAAENVVPASADLALAQSSIGTGSDDEDDEEDITRNELPTTRTDRSVSPQLDAVASLAGAANASATATTTSAAIVLDGDETDGCGVLQDESNEQQQGQQQQGQLNVQQAAAAEGQQAAAQRVASMMARQVARLAPLVAAGRLLDFEIRRPGASAAVLELLAAEYGTQVSEPIATAWEVLLEEQKWQEAEELAAYEAVRAPPATAAPPSRAQTSAAAVPAAAEQHAAPASTTAELSGTGPLPQQAQCAQQQQLQQQPQQHVPLLDLQQQQEEQQQQLLQQQHHQEVVPEQPTHQLKRRRGRPKKQQVAEDIHPGALDVVHGGALLGNWQQQQDIDHPVLPPTAEAVCSGAVQLPTDADIAAALAAAAALAGTAAAGQAGTEEPHDAVEQQHYRPAAGASMQQLPRQLRSATGLISQQRQQQEEQTALQMSALADASVAAAAAAAEAVGASSAADENKRPGSRAASIKSSKGSSRQSRAISQTGHTCRGRVRQKSHKTTELVELGKLVPRPQWYNAGYIFPAGFKSQLLFRSSVDIDVLTLHECEIIGEGGQFWPAPTFVVTARDREDQPIVAKSCTGCWSGILKRINTTIAKRIEEGENLPPPPRTAIAGPEYFGLNDMSTIAAIETLDPQHLCTTYWIGKEQREAAAAGMPVPAPLLTGRTGDQSVPAADATGGGGSSSTGRKRGRSRAAGRDPTVNDADDEGTGYRGAHWSSISRRERYIKRCTEAGEEAPVVEGQELLPGVLDPITLEPVVNPAISPAGHVMGLATWKAVLAENPRCPFTKASLRPDMLTVLTKHNIERHRHRIIAAK